MQRAASTGLKLMSAITGLRVVEYLSRGGQSIERWLSATKRWRLNHIHLGTW